MTYPLLTGKTKNRKYYHIYHLSKITNGSLIHHGMLSTAHQKFAISEPTLAQKKKKTLIKIGKVGTL